MATTSCQPDLEPDPSLTNEDLKPTTSDQRTLSGAEMALFWAALVVGVPIYYLAGSLIDLGMAWWQGIATVIIANVIILFPLILTAHPGTCYGISFPVLCRSAFGIRGAHIPTLLRALVACGWFGIESWIGGQAIFLLLPRIVRESGFGEPVSWLGTSPVEFACFVAFWGVQLAFVCRGMDGIRAVERYSAPILIALTCCLLVWACLKAGGFSQMTSLTSRLENSEFWALFFPALTANIGSWSTLALNIPDFSRFAKSQKDQITGQMGLPLFMGAFTFVGVVVTSSTQVIFGRVISDPVQVLGQMDGVLIKILAIFGISLATITTNVPANVVAPANALVNLNPKMFTFRRGAILTSLLGIVFQPWRLYGTSENFVHKWLVGYSALMGPIGGIILADYYLIRRTNLSIKDLYTLSSDGDYYYSMGYNFVAIGALMLGILPVIPGFLHEVGILSSVLRIFTLIYDNSWFFGFFSAGIVYWIVSSVTGKGINDQLMDPLLSHETKI